MVEAYKWFDVVRMDAFFDGQDAYEFVYEERARLPYAMRRGDGTVLLLYYDQVGSLRVVADASGNVIKEILYDPFGGIIEDSRPELRIPLGFAGGLHDRDLGFVRFGWRDYDTVTGRWTAPDPLGDKGGDPDWYGYCLDDPVNFKDSKGLLAAGVVPGPFGVPLAPIFIPGTEENNAFVRNTIEGVRKLWESFDDSDELDSFEGDLFYEEHSRRGSKSPSKRSKHQKGKQRRKKDAHGGERGDLRRPYRRK